MHSGPAALQAEILRHPLMRLATHDAARAGLLGQHRWRAIAALDLQQPVPRGRAPELGAIAAPTLVLNGSLDSAARRAAGRALQAAIPGARHSRAGRRRDIWRRWMIQPATPRGVESRVLPTIAASRLAATPGRR